MMTIRDRQTLLDEALAQTASLRERLVTSITPATISPIAKIPFKVQAFREMLLHRVSDLSDSACILYKNGSTIPAFVLTRAAFETMALMYYFNKSIEKAIKDGTTEAIDTLAMKSLFGTKDKSTEYEAVNILTAISHLEKQFPGLQDMFSFLCEFAHPNYAGVAGAYQDIASSQPNDPNKAVFLGPATAQLDQRCGLNCLIVSITISFWFANTLASKDAEIIQLCESQLRNR